MMNWLYILDAFRKRIEHVFYCSCVRLFANSDAHITGLIPFTLDMVELVRNLVAHGDARVVEVKGKLANGVGS